MRNRSSVLVNILILMAVLALAIFALSQIQTGDGAGSGHYLIDGTPIPTIHIAPRQIGTNEWIGHSDGGGLANP